MMGKEKNDTEIETHSQVYIEIFQSNWKKREREKKINPVNQIKI